MVWLCKMENKIKQHEISIVTNYIIYKKKLAKEVRFWFVFDYCVLCET